MKLRFLGAAGTVTGSKYLLESGGKKYLVDCGLFQGLKKLRLKNWAHFPIPPKDITAVILTHAHLDHTGYLPKLVREGFKGPIYATQSTSRLSEILLYDCAHIMQEDASYANKKGFSKHKPALPLYTWDDVKNTLPLFKDVAFGDELSLDANTKVVFNRAGHILGAATLRFTIGNTSLLFSGDLGRPKDPMMHPPHAIGKVDYLVVESTYGDREHEKVSPLDQLEEVINNAVAQKGVVVIPAFAVGRSQIILYYLSVLKKQGRLPDIPIFLDSPMATNVTDLYCSRREDHMLDAGECSQMCSIAKYVHSPNESQAIDQRHGSMVILSASGMATGGRVLHHLKAFAGKDKNVILFAGYQATGTRGADLIQGKTSLKIHGQQHGVRAQVKVIENLSAHADRNEILAWLNTATHPPKRTFITHGDPAASNSLCKQIEQTLQWNCLIPEQDQIIDLGH